MSKEINIDEILTRSKKQAEEKKHKESTVVIDSETGEKMPNKKANTQQQEFGGPTGMPGDFSQVFNNPDIMNMFSSGNVPGFKGLPLKQRLMFKLMGFFAKPGRKNLLKKRWWPIWAVLLVILLAVGVVVGAFFLVYKVLKALLMPYINIFKRKG